MKAEKIVKSKRKEMILGFGQCVWERFLQAAAPERGRSVRSHLPDRRYRGASREEANGENVSEENNGDSLKKSHLSWIGLPIPITQVSMRQRSWDILQRKA